MIVCADLSSLCFHQYHSPAWTSVRYCHLKAFISTMPSIKVSYLCVCAVVCVQAVSLRLCLYLARLVCAGGGTGSAAWCNWSPLTAWSPCGAQKQRYHTAPILFTRFFKNGGVASHTWESEVLATQIWVSMEKVFHLWQVKFKTRRTQHSAQWRSSKWQVTISETHFCWEEGDLTTDNN